MKKRSGHSSVLSTILRIALGVVFLVSGSAKLIDIDYTELYVYSLNLFSFDASTVITRLVISAELFLGLGLIVGLFRRFFWWSSLLLLILFTLFLILDWIFGKGENCNCFGDLLSTKHWVSILRNLFLILLLFLCRQPDAKPKPWVKYSGLVLLLAALVMPFILSPPDFVYFKAAGVEPGSRFQYSHCMDETKTALDAFFDKHPMDGKKILCFYTTKCEFCRKTARKVSIMANRLGITGEVRIFYSGSKPAYEEFSVETHSGNIPATALQMKDLIRLTKGDLPTILVIEDTAIRYRYGYRDLSEADIAAFFNR